MPVPSSAPQARESGVAPVNGVKLYYAIYGQGDPILLIHGGLGHADLWANQIVDLSKDHAVIVADTRGHARSTRDEQAYGYDLLAADYLALLDYLKIDRVTLVGWSDGGIIGLDIAAKHPERLVKLFAHAANSKVDGVKPDVLENKVFAAYIIDEDMYKWRYLIENFFCKLKEFKRIALRADKTDQSFKAMIHLAAAVINSR